MCISSRAGGRAEYVDRGRLPCVSCKGLGRRAHVLMYPCIHRARVYVCGLAGVSFNGIFPVFRVFRVSRVLRLFRGQKVRANVPAQAVTDGLASSRPVQVLQVLVHSVASSIPGVLAVSGILVMFVYIFASMGQAFFSGHWVETSSRSDLRCAQP